MPERDITFAIFIDYDNLLPAQKSAGILDVITRALIQLPFDTGIFRGKCDVRVYGGWYEGTHITRLAEDVAVEIQREFPTVIRLPISGRDHVSLLANAELAVALIQEPGHHLFNTYRRKGKPANVRVKEPAIVGCTENACILPMMKRLLRTGSCPQVNCAVAMNDLVYRNEQKIVDTMLSCDLIHAANGIADRIILVSGDDDFLPPLRTVLLRGVSAIRFHPKRNSQRASFPQGGAQLLEKEL